MLILSRNEGQKITLGEPGKTTTFEGEITVTVVELDRNKVRLGFEAPKHVGIYRDDATSRYRKPDRLVGDAFATGDDALSPQEIADLKAGRGLR